MSNTSSSKVECVARVANRLGETPLWCDRTQTLYWLDIEQPAVFSLGPSARDPAKIERSCNYLGSQALTETGGHLFAEDLSLVTADNVAEKGQLLTEVECRIDNGKDIDNRLNDGRVDVQGRLWIGTMDNEYIRPNGSLYRVDPDGSVAHILGDVKVSNGIAFSPDGRLLYFTDTRRHLSFALTIDPDDGVVTDKKIFADYSATGKRPDGACVDADGCLWAAFFGGAQIVRYTPNGKIDLAVDLPVTNPTCLCFGGADFKTLYITTATKFLNEEQQASEPLAGALLAIHGIGQGVKENRFGI